MKTFCCGLLVFIFPMVSMANDSHIASLYKKHNIEGSLIIESLNGKIKFVHNDIRSEQKFLPASTFKIPNTLIALEEGVIKNENEIFKWDGVDKGFPAWNADQTLKTAFSVSCVWCYQKVARKIGNDRYLEYLNKMHYGNMRTGRDVTTFWLEGDLSISAKEQIEFIRKLYKAELPINRKHIDTLKAIMITEKTPNYTVSAKTGWANRISDQHGWYVGYIETDDGVWLFANNISIKSKADLKYRKELVIESFKIKGLI